MVKVIPPKYSGYVADKEYINLHPELFPAEVLKALTERKDPKLSEFRFKGWIIQSFGTVGIRPDAPQEAKDEWMNDWELMRDGFDL